MDLSCSIRHLEFCSQSCNQFPYVQHPAFKLKVDTSSTFFHIQEATIKKDMLLKIYFHGRVFFCSGIDSPPVGLTVHFSLNLYHAAG